MDDKNHCFTTTFQFRTSALFYPCPNKSASLASLLNDQKVRICVITTEIYKKDNSIHANFNVYYIPAQQSWRVGVGVGGGGGGGGGGWGGGGGVGWGGGGVYWIHLVRPSVRPSVCRRHGFRSISQVSCGISISNFICMLIVAIGRSLLIFNDVTFKMAAWRPYWIFWFPDSNFTSALNINFKLQRHNTYVYG